LTVAFPTIFHADAANTGMIFEYFNELDYFLTGFRI